MPTTRYDILSTAATLAHSCNLRPAGIQVKTQSWPVFSPVSEASTSTDCQLDPSLPYHGILFYVKPGQVASRHHERVHTRRFLLGATESGYWMQLVITEMRRRESKAHSIQGKGQSQAPSSWITGLYISSTTEGYESTLEDAILPKGAYKSDVPLLRDDSLSTIRNQLNCIDPLSVVPFILALFMTFPLEPCRTDIQTVHELWIGETFGDVLFRRDTSCLPACRACGQEWDYAQCVHVRAARVHWITGPAHRLRPAPEAIYDPTCCCSERCHPSSTFNRFFSGCDLGTTEVQPIKPASDAKIQYDVKTESKPELSSVAKQSVISTVAHSPAPVPPVVLPTEQKRVSFVARPSTNVKTVAASLRQAVQDVDDDPKTTKDTTVFVLGEIYEGRSGRDFVTVNEAKRVLGGHWLNDASMDHVISYLIRNLPHIKSHGVYFYPKVKYFFGGKRDRREQDEFLRVHGRLDFFASDIRAVLMPINIDNAHWILAIIGSPGGLISEKEPEEESRPTIAICDSFGCAYSDVADNLAAFLVSKAEYKGFKPVPERIQKLRFPVPRQTDATSCGYFVLEWCRQLCDRFDEIYSWCLEKAMRPRRGDPTKGQVKDIWRFRDQEGLKSDLQDLYQEWFENRLR